MHLTFAAPEPALHAALEAAFDGVENTTVTAQSILELDCDALVSPANSFGFMDGGIDRIYVAHFGEQVQTAVRTAILRDWHGELPVGCAAMVETGNTAIPYLIAAPTMRVPMFLGPNTVVPYVAARAVLRLVRHGHLPDGRQIADVVRHIAFPGLGTGIGGVPPEVAARQMARAVAEHRDAPARLPTSWAEASEHHVLLYADKARDLQ